MSLVSHLKRLRRIGHFYKDRYYSGEYELTLLGRLVDQRKDAIDVGGNVGAYTYFLSRLARRVVAFEPNARYAAGLRSLHLANVTVEEVALSDRAGVAELRIPLANSGAEEEGMASIDADAVSEASVARRIEVATRRIDDYRFEAVGFMKIDVEGHEEGGAQRGEETLTRCRPNLLIEIEERRKPGSVKRVQSMLRGLGYDGYFYENSARRPIGEFDVAKHQPRPLVWDNAKHTRRTFPLINNFVFLPQ